MELVLPIRLVESFGYTPETQPTLNKILSIGVVEDVSGKEMKLISVKEKSVDAFN